MKTRFELLPSQSAKKPNVLKRLFIKLTTGIRNLFKAEEVEVTFKVEGTRVSYTYTKVEEQKVA